MNTNKDVNRFDYRDPKRRAELGLSPISQIPCNRYRFEDEVEKRQRTKRGFVILLLASAAFWALLAYLML